MTTKPKRKITGGPVYVTRFYHAGAKKYLIASDYGLKAFPIGKRKR